MVSIERTTKKYRGKYAADYVAVRSKQERWTLENMSVESLMSGVSAKSTVLDAPCGTGRFFPLWKKLKLVATGVDANADMLVQVKLYTGASGSSSAVKSDILDFCVVTDDRAFDAAVCVRFLDLIDEEAMRKVVKELCRVTRDRVILTIRLGEKYVAKTNTAVHDEKKFLQLVKRCGWEPDQTIPIFNQGWQVIRLRRKS